jgi:tRNA 2-thiouridine synthesizing protein A
MKHKSIEVVNKMAQENIKETLDASGLSCPLPVLKTKKAMKNLAVGEILKVISTDPGSKKDMASWSRMTGQELMESTEEDGKFVYLIKKLK